MVTMMAPNYSFIDSRNLLIRPDERVRFVFFFLTATIAGSLIARHLNHQLDYMMFGEQCKLPCAIAEGSTVGLLVGTFQWLALRLYIPSRAWILVFTINSVLISCFGALTRMAFRSIQDGKAFFIPLPMAPILFFAISLLILTTFGYLQWRVWVHPSLARLILRSSH